MPVRAMKRLDAMAFPPNVPSGATEDQNALANQNSYAHSAFSGSSDFFKSGMN